MCSPCSQGTFCAGSVPFEGGDATGLGTSGSWTVPGSIAGDVFPMPGGKWANSAGGEVEGNLEDCEAGFYCTVGEYAP
jgi:hypothetical protein